MLSLPNYFAVSRFMSKATLIRYAEVEGETEKDQNVQLSADPLGVGSVLIVFASANLSIIALCSMLKYLMSCISSARCMKNKFLFEIQPNFKPELHKKLTISKLLLGMASYGSTAKLA